jgi:hypothetical protein
MPRWLVVLFLCTPILLSAAENGSDDIEPGLNAKTFKGLELRGIGLALMSGRMPWSPGRTMPDAH